MSNESTMSVGSVTNVVAQPATPAKQSVKKKYMYTVVYDNMSQCYTFTNIRKIFDNQILNPVWNLNWIDYKSLRNDFKNGFFNITDGTRMSFKDKHGVTYKIFVSQINP